MTITVSGETIDDILATIGPLVGAAPNLDDMPLQELLLYADQRCQAEGYDLSVVKRDETVNRELREGLKDEVSATKKRTPKPKPEPEAAPVAPEVAPEPEAELPGKISTPEPQANGQAESDADRKARCISALQKMFAGPEKQKKAVMHLLARYGGGSRTFHTLPVETFIEIDKALQEFNL